MSFRNSIQNVYTYFYNVHKRCFVKRLFVSQVKEKQGTHILNLR